MNSSGFSSHTASNRSKIARRVAGYAVVVASWLAVFASLGRVQAYLVAGQEVLLNDNHLYVLGMLVLVLWLPVWLTVHRAHREFKYGAYPGELLASSLRTPVRRHTRFLGIFRMDMKAKWEKAPKKDGFVEFNLNWQEFQNSLRAQLNQKPDKGENK